MATKNELISDIELRLTRGKLSDDFEVEKKQISHWIDIVRDMLVTESLNGELKADGIVNPFYVEEEQCKILVNESSNCNDDCYDRYYVDITTDALNLIGDKGIDYVSNQGNHEIYKIAATDLSFLKHLAWSKPSRINQTYYREAKRLYLQGLDKKIRANASIHVHYIKAMVGANVAWTIEYLVSPEILPFLLEEVENIARRQLDKNTSYEDQINDGVQE